MSAKRPLQALFSFGVVALGFLAPWQLGMLSPEVELTPVHVTSAPERLVTVVQPQWSEPLDRKSRRGGEVCTACLQGPGSEHVQGRMT